MTTNMEIDDQPEFSADLLRVYYSRLFPYKQMCSWLGYGTKGAKEDGDGSILARREFSFTLEGDVYIRYQCFAEADEMRSAMLSRMPIKIDIGAVFNVSPTEHIRAKRFSPMERELVFDIDMNDYDDVRTCCVGAKTCRKCWGFMCASVQVVEATLREDFGYEHTLWVYSGRRGVHCWVCDAGARALTNECRSAVVSYMSLVHGNESTAKKVKISWPLHPSLVRAYDILEPLFVEYIIGEGGQKLLSEKEQWDKLLATLPEDICKKFKQHWDKNPSTPTAKWEALKSLSKPKETDSGSAKKQKIPSVSELWKYETVFTYCYPRLDEHVSKQRNHLLKSPFAVHPKTGRVCVPFEAAKVKSFDPTAVVTVKELAAQIDAGAEAGLPDLQRTSLAPTIEFFERSFLKPLQASLHKARRDGNEKDAAQYGDF